MQHSFIRQNNTPHLTLFFAGWGMDVSPFKSIDILPSLIKKEDDLCIVYNYCSLSFDPNIMLPYSQVTVLAWSLGVWATEQIDLSHCNYFYAINGTPQPVDNKNGIPVAIFEGTLHHLSVITLNKFYRRMCHHRLVLEYFENHKPQHSLEHLKEELSFIGTHAIQPSPFPKRWNKAWIGTFDHIFPTDNQGYYWESQSVATEALPMPHFPLIIHE